MGLERIEWEGTNQNDSFVTWARKEGGHSIERDDPSHSLRFLHYLFIPGDQGAASTPAPRACKCVVIFVQCCRNVSPVGVLMTP